MRLFTPCRLRSKGPRWLTVASLLVMLMRASSAWPKEHGVHSPSGRTIYAPEETFGEVENQASRHFVVEVVTGLAPEGNLGLLVGILNQPFKGLEWYSGYAFEATPARSIPLEARYFFNFDGYRPFLATGYIYRRVPNIDVVSHNVFFEVGYKWVVHSTYHLTLGVGVRRPLDVCVLEGSPLSDPTTDPELLDDSLEGTQQWVPAVSLRFSRAF